MPSNNKLLQSEADFGTRFCLADQKVPLEEMAVIHHKKLFHLS